MPSPLLSSRLRRNCPLSSASSHPLPVAEVSRENEPRRGLKKMSVRRGFFETAPDIYLVTCSSIKSFCSLLQFREAFMFEGLFQPMHLLVICGLALLVF